MKICEECGLEFIPKTNWDKLYKRFCNLSCAAKASNRKRPIHSEEHNKKIADAIRLKHERGEYKNVLRKKYNNLLSTDERSKRVGGGTKNKFKGDKATSLLEFSKRTVSKILKRLNIGCSICSWNESTCDIHHINGRKIPDPHNHTNLTLLCPNCHRLVHNNKILKSDLKNLYDILGDRWKDYYYG